MLEAPVAQPKGVSACKSCLTATIVCIVPEPAYRCGAQPTGKQVQILSKPRIPYMQDAFRHLHAEPTT